MDKEHEQGVRRKANSQCTMQCGLAWWLSGQESACSAGDTGGAGSIPASDSPEEEMATHCSILAWDIPWTQESGGLQS